MKTATKVTIISTTAVLVAFDIAATATTRHGWYTPATLTMALATGVIYVAAGLVGATKRPESRVGPLLCIAGLLFLIGMLSQSDLALPFTIGGITYWIALAVIGHIIVTFPTGRIHAWTERLLIGFYYANSVGLTLAAWFFYDTREGCSVCPRNVLLIRSDPVLAGRIDELATWLGVASAATAIGMLAYRWWHASAAGRRVFGPPLWVGSALTIEYIVTVGFNPEWLLPTSRFFFVDQFLTAAYPLAFMVGLLRTRMSRSAVSDLVIELGRGTMPVGGLRDALAQRLGDPSLQLAYAVEEAGGWVDEGGRATKLPEPGTGRTATTLELEGEPIAALIHDDALEADPELVDAVASAARLAVVNERLQARVRAQLELVRASRTRVLDAADEERRRLERDLHDGAQQRLIWLSLLLGIAEEEIASGDGVEGRRLLEEARAEAEGSLTELRDLARGIHPAILTNAGLGPAIDSLVNRSPVAVLVDTIEDRRFPPTVEATTYFVVAEALTNAAKHSQATSVRLSIAQADGRLIVDVADDGVGGADADGAGLRGLADRVAAAGGTITITSPPEGGTRLHMELPCE